MCELPARSMPGSEMLLVDKTRMRGTKGSLVWSCAGGVRHHYFIFLT